MIKTILFDLDDTILDFHKAEGIALRKALEQMRLEPTDEVIARYSEINRLHWERLERGELTREQVLTQRFEMLFSEFGMECSGEEMQKVYEKLLAVGHYFMPGAEELLETLYGTYHLYLVTNGTASVQDGRIASAGIARYFKEIFISQRIGFDKPQTAYFEYCFERIPDFSREETIIIGDSLTSDMLGGNNAGIHTCWYNPKKNARRADIPVEFEIAALDEVEGVLHTFI